MVRSSSNLPSQEFLWLMKRVLKNYREGQPIILGRMDEDFTTKKFLLARTLHSLETGN